MDKMIVKRVALKGNEVNRGRKFMLRRERTSF